MTRKSIPSSDELTAAFPMVFLDLADVKPLVSRVVVDYAKGIGEAIRHLVSSVMNGLVYQRPLMLKSARTRRSAFLAVSRIRRSATADRAEGNHASMEETLRCADAGATKSPPRS